MKKIYPALLLTAILLIQSSSTWAVSTLIAGWDFQTTAGGGTAAAAAPSSPTTYVANVGTGTIYMNNTNGASSWVTATSGNELTSFGGTALNTAGTTLATATTSALAIVGGVGGTAANGKRIVFKFSMTGLTNLVVSYATQGTGTGFSTQTWEYSTDGTNWFGAQAIGSIPTSFAVKTLTTITGLDNASVAYLRLTPTGASNASGNNRLDNIQLNATVGGSSLSGSQLLSFGNVCTGTTAGPNSFTITGTSLSAANVTVGALTGFSYSTTSGGTYTSSLSLTQPGGAYSQQIFVKFNPTLVQSYSGNIAVGGGGASSVNVADTGVGVNTLPTVVTGATTGITTTSATCAGSITVNGCSATTDYGIEYSLTNNFTTGTGTQVSSTNISGGNFTALLTPLLPGTTYYYRAYATTAVSTYYGSQSSFLTTALVATLSSGSLPSFGNVCTGTTAGPNSFTITGSGLTTANVNVGPLTGFTFSTTSGGSYTSSLSLTQPGGAYSQAIFVKFSPTLVQSYAGNIPVNGGGALLSSDVAADGTGVAPPAQPSAIVGLASPCKSTAGVTYSITNVPGTTYAWTFPSGWTQTAGTNTNSITVTTGTNTSGTVRVTPNNGICDGPLQSLAVTPVNIPSQPSAISGSAGVCSGATGLTYSVTNVSGMTYTWVLPSGWSQTAGGTSNSITVDAGTTGGTITVTPSNAACSGTPQTLAVSILALPVITSATSTTACTGGPVTLTVNGSNFSDYRWSNASAATSGLVYQQNFNSLPSTVSVSWVDNTTLPGWYASSNNIGSTGLNFGAGTNTQGGLYSFGAAASSERALGSLASSGTNTITYGVKLDNSTGAPVNRIFVQYTGEQWRDGGLGAVVNTLAFSYSTTATNLTTGTYTAATTLDYPSTVISGTTAAAVNGNANQTIKTATITLATPLAAGASIWLKWSDADNTGSDMAVALDDLTVIMYNNSSTLLATPAASVSTSTFGSGGMMTSAAYTAAAVATGGVYTVEVSNVAGCASSSTTTVVVNSPATAQANTTPTATFTNAGTYTLSGSATNYASYSWSTNGAGVLSNTNTLSPTYDPAQNETGHVTVTLTVNALAPCASPVVDSMVLNITPAAGNTWLGVNQDWFDVNNWTSGVAPNGCNAIANIPVVGSNIYPLINASSPQVGNLAIGSGTSITINSGKTLGVCGNWTGGTTTTANILGAGVVILNGTTAQTVSGKNSFTTLTINKTAGTTTFSGSHDIHTALIMTRGNVVNSAAGNSAVTLKSDASGTAYLDNFTSGTAGTYTGTLTVERYTGTNTSIGYRDLSSPVSARVLQWMDNFSITGLDGVNCWYAYNPYPSLQYYNESTNNVTADYYGGFISTTDQANILTACKGYAARLYTLPSTINTTGAPNTGAQSIAITKTPSSIPSADGWNLLGNPYPSAISWNAIKTANPLKTDGSVYRFTATGEYTGNYATWNGTTGTNGATDQIASTEGFWVLASASNTINMDNTVRVASTTSPFFKTNSVQPDEVRLVLSNGANTDEVVEYTDPAATAGYDAGYDAAKMAAGSTVYLSYNMPAREMAINVMNEITATTELPLRIAVQDSGAYTLTATVLNLTTLNAYLKDTASNILTDLSAGPVSLTLAGHQDYSNRWAVVFRNKTATAVANVDEHSIQVYAYDGKVYVTRPSSSPAVISISNILGQEIAQVTSTQERNIIPLSAAQPWYATVRITEGNTVTTKKVLISTK